MTLTSLTFLRPSLTATPRLARWMMAATLGFSSTGCIATIWGDGEIIEESRSLVGTPSRVAIHDGFDVVLTVDASVAAPTLTVRTDRNLMKHVVTQIVGDEVQIYSSSERMLHGTHGLRVDLRLPVLTELRASEGVDATVLANGTERLYVHASGGSDLSLQGSFQQLSVLASGGSDIKLVGSAVFAEVHARGGSDLNARQCAIVDADLLASGGSDVSLCVTGTLSGSVSGGSDVDYFCHPVVVDLDNSGGSDVKGH